MFLSNMIPKIQDYIPSKWVKSDHPNGWKRSLLLVSPKNSRVECAWNRCNMRCLQLKFLEPRTGWSLFRTRRRRWRTGGWRDHPWETRPAGLTTNEWIPGLRGLFQYGISGGCLVVIRGVHFPNHHFWWNYVNFHLFSREYIFQPWDFQGMFASFQGTCK